MVDSTPTNGLNINRRNFLKATSVAGGGLVMTVALPACSTLKNGGINASSGQEGWDSNAWLRINTDNTIHFVVDRTEMGQNTYTGLTSLLAEELEVNPEAVQVSFAEANSVYRNTVYKLQITGASTSIVSSWQIIRECGAATRMMLIQAAANTWGVKPDQCYAEQGNVIHKANGAKLSYGQLATIAATYSIPSDIPLKDKSEFKVIGKYNKRLDAKQKATGTADFGIDTDLPGMLYAVVTRAGRWDSKVKSFDASTAKNVAGVVDVFEINAPSAVGVAVVAKSYWQARKAQQQLIVEWHESQLNTVSDDSIFQQYQTDMAEDSGKNVRDDGDIEQALETASQTIKAEFKMPFLAHATLEPQNCTAWAKEDGLEIWAPTQGPDMAQIAAAKASRYSLKDIKVNVTFIGGGFGRRINNDYVAEAAAIADKLQKPIKLIWSREEDTKRDFYRPSSYHQLTATLDAQDNITGWQHQMAGSGVFDYFVGEAAPAQYSFAPKFMYGMLESAGKLGEGIIAPADTSIYEGANHLPYEFENVSVDYKKSDSGILVGNWRSVGHSHTGFITETFIDQLADNQKKDPVQFRLDLLKNDARATHVLKTAAEKANWGSPLPGCTQGVSLHKSFGTWVAQIADVEVTGTSLKVKRVVCAVDCGQVVNPDTVEAQMEGGIIFALTAALYGKITIVDGEPQQNNFYDYQLLRINESPDIQVHIIDSDEFPSGVGEPGVPPLAAAVANAVTRKTGQRFYSLPLELKS